MAVSVTLTACGTASSASNETVASTPGSIFQSSVPGIVADEPIPTERCAANQEAGTITFLTGSDLAAAAANIDVIEAEAAGYFDDLCLDVDIQSSEAGANYELVASGAAQFASGNSFSEVVAFAAANDADLLAATVEGRTTLDTLIVRAGDATELSDLADTRIGVADQLPPSIDLMLRNAGLTGGESFQTVQLTDADPVAHFELDLQAISGTKSGDVGAFERAGVGVQIFDPLDAGIPGSFGVLFTSAEFTASHPTAAQDFIRAAMRGLADAVADPSNAAAEAVDLNGTNPNATPLSIDAETFRWETEASLILEGTPEGMGLGVPDLVGLQAEVDAYAAIGLFGDGPTPLVDDYLALDLATGVYDDSVLAWPS